MVRRCATKAERREALEAYRDQLKNELAGVEERLEELAAESPAGPKGVTTPPSGPPLP